MGKSKSTKSRVDRTARYSVYDFIDAVHSHPQLWERQHTDYHNRDRREKAWQDVGRRLYNKFNDMSEQERQKTVVFLTKRWKNTRDSYFRARRRNPVKKEDDENARSYIYEKEMSFLLKNEEYEADVDVGDAGNTNMAAEDQEEEADEDEEETAAEEEFIKMETGGDVAVILPIKRGSKRKSNSSNTRSQRKRQKSTSPAASNSELENATVSTAAVATKQLQIEATQDASFDVSDLAYAPEEATSTTNAAASCSVVKEALAEPDPDQSFFDSIRPVVRSMTMDQRLDFQIEILKLLKHIRGKK